MLTHKDLILLDKLRKNARKSLSKISKETRIPVSTLFDKLKKLENNIIIRHTSLVDFSKLGYSLKINFAIKTREKQELRNYLMKNKHVNSLYKSVDDYFYVEALFRNMKELFEFREYIEAHFKVEKIDEHHIIEDLKKEGFLLL